MHSDYVWSKAKALKLILSTSLFSEKKLLSKHPSENMLSLSEETEKGPTVAAKAAVTLLDSTSVSSTVQNSIAHIGKHCSLKYIVFYFCFCFISICGDGKLILGVSY